MLTDLDLNKIKKKVTPHILYLVKILENEEINAKYYVFIPTKGMVDTIWGIFLNTFLPIFI